MRESNPELHKQNVSKSLLKTYSELTPENQAKVFKKVIRSTNE